MRHLSTVSRDRLAGFTLLELLVVMVIIGLLAGFVAPRYFAQVGKSQVKAARSQIDALEKALDQYRIDMGRYPTTDEGLLLRTRSRSHVRSPRRWKPHTSGALCTATSSPPISKCAATAP